MNENSCRNICAYYDANSKDRDLQTDTLRKYCPICNLELISRYSTCPCCHGLFWKDKK